MEPKDIKAIDTMCRLFYCKGEAAKSMVDFYEGKVMAYTTFGGWMKKFGIKPGEEWKILASVGKPSVEEMVVEMDDIGVEYVFMDQGIAWSRHDQRLWITADFSNTPGQIFSIETIRIQRKMRTVLFDGANRQ